MTKAENDPHKQDPAGLFETALAPGAQKAEKTSRPDRRCSLKPIALFELRLGLGFMGTGIC